MSKVLVTGSQGFIGGYVVEELLGRGHSVVGLDNFSKYGRISKSYDSHPNYHFVEGDATNVDLMTSLLMDCDHMIAGAALIGGISYFHTYAYDLLANNERILASTCDAAIRAHRQGKLQKVTYLSSSMVFESTTTWPSVEVMSVAYHHHFPLTDFRNWQWSTLPRLHGISTNCRTPLFVRSTLLEWEKVVL